MDRDEQNRKAIEADRAASGQVAFGDVVSDATAVAHAQLAQLAPGIRSRVAASLADGDGHLVLSVTMMSAAPRVALQWRRSTAEAVTLAHDCLGAVAVETAAEFLSALGAFVTEALNRHSESTRAAIGQALACGAALVLELALHAGRAEAVLEIRAAGARHVNLVSVHSETTDVDA